MIKYFSVTEHKEVVNMINKILFLLAEQRIKKLSIEHASLYVAKTKLSKAQKMQLLMDKGLTKAEAEAAILTANNTLNRAIRGVNE